MFFALLYAWFDQHHHVFLERHPSVDMSDFNLQEARPILEGAKYTTVLLLIPVIRRGATE